MLHYQDEGADISPECKELINDMIWCESGALLKRLSEIDTWTFGHFKMEHWEPVIQRFHGLLVEAAAYRDNKWNLRCNTYSSSDINMVTRILSFTSLLIKNVTSCPMVMSADAIVRLLGSSDTVIVAWVMNLLTTYGRKTDIRGNMTDEQSVELALQLHRLAETWNVNDKEYTLAHACDSERPAPRAGSKVHFQFYNVNAFNAELVTINIDHVDPAEGKTPTVILEELILKYNVPAREVDLLYAQIRLAYNFSDFNNRMLCTRIRFQALIILAQMNELEAYAYHLTENNFIRELVEVIEMPWLDFLYVRVNAIRTLSALLRLERNENFSNGLGSALNTKILKVLKADRCSGTLTVLANNFIINVSSERPYDIELFPAPLITAYFNFLYYIADYEAGAKALACSGILYSLLDVVKFHTTDLNNINSASRIVRVINIVTKSTMLGIGFFGGLEILIERLASEVNQCVNEHLWEFNLSPTDNSSFVYQFAMMRHNIGKKCMRQRETLLNGLLSLLKQLLLTWADSTHRVTHLATASIPDTLKKIICNAEYYGVTVAFLAVRVAFAYQNKMDSVLPNRKNMLPDVIYYTLTLKGLKVDTDEEWNTIVTELNSLSAQVRKWNPQVPCVPL